MRKSKPIRVKIPRVSRGQERKFIRCKECGRVYFKDFTPYSLSNPITWTPCGHSIGHRYDLNCREISEDVFHRLRAKELAREFKDRHLA